MHDASLSVHYLAACAVVREAGALARVRFADRGGLEHSFKGPQDYLTTVDGEVEGLVRQRLNGAFPQDSILGEEDGGSVSTVTWVIDPIDGTANFARGIPFFCVSLALVIDGRTVVGAIYDPMADELFSAWRGMGAWMNGHPMKTSAVKSMKQASVELGWSPRRPHDAYAALIMQVLKAGASFRRAGSGALGLAYVADGRSDGYAELHINSWDCLAGLLMVWEAGGWHNDFLAKDGMLKGGPVIACNKGIKEAFIKATGLGR